MTQTYQCCFCGKVIDATDTEAVQLIGQNLWNRGRDEAAQAVYAHSKCAQEAMAAGQFSPFALLDGRGYSLQEILWGEHDARRITLPRWGCLLIAALLAAALIVIIVR
jgi:hypothetical protein